MFPTVVVLTLLTAHFFRTTLDKSSALQFLVYLQKACLIGVIMTYLYLDIINSVFLASYRIYMLYLAFKDSYETI